MEIKEVINLLKESLEELRNEPSLKQFRGGTFSTWKWKVRSILINGLTENAWLPVKQWDTATIALPMPDTTIDPGWQEGSFERHFEQKLPNVEATLQNIIWQLETFGTPYATSEKEEGAPKAFIAHGGKSEVRDKLCQFLTALGVTPLIVEEQPSEGRSVGENVDWYARQADCAIILATKGDIDGKTGRFIPRGNVLIEIGKSQELFKDRIIYLLQAGARLPTNISEKVRARFTTQNMDNAFIKIATELRKFGILRAVKP